MFLDPDYVINALLERFVVITSDLKPASNNIQFSFYYSPFSTLLYFIIFCLLPSPSPSPSPSPFSLFLFFLFFLFFYSFFSSSSSCPPPSCSSCSCSSLHLILGLAPSTGFSLAHYVYPAHPALMPIQMWPWWKAC